jgi:hypothetical protein
LRPGVGSVRLRDPDPNSPPRPSPEMAALCSCAWARRQRLATVFRPEQGETAERRAIPADRAANNTFISSRFEEISHTPREQKNRENNRTTTDAYQGEIRRANRAGRPPRRSPVRRWRYAFGAWVTGRAARHPAPYWHNLSRPPPAVSRQRGVLAPRFDQIAECASAESPVLSPCR